MSKRILIIIFIVLAFSIILIGCGKSETKSKGAQKGGELIIVKDEITDKATFFPYEIDGTKMEVVAVRASDGTVRTAFNTCQVCYGSGRGYYKQENAGDPLICQNCGNRFTVDQVEVVKGGCNPVPILEDLKFEDEESVKISEELFIQAKQLFASWK